MDQTVLLVILGSVLGGFIGWIIGFHLGRWAVRKRLRRPRNAIETLESFLKWVQDLLDEIYREQALHEEERGQRLEESSIGG